MQPGRTAWTAECGAKPVPDDSEPVDSRAELLRGWGLSPVARTRLFELREARDLEPILAQPPKRGLIARGAGHSLGDAAQRAGGGVVSTTNLARIVSFDSEQGLITAEAGATLEQLLRAVLPSGWSVPVLPGTRFVTLGGAIAGDVHGRNHPRDGSFGSHVVELRLRTPAGATTIGPEHDADLFWATVGGMGLTGVILEATLRLLRVETGLVLARTERLRDLDDALERMTTDEQSFRYNAAWIDSLAGGSTLGRGVLVRGNHATRGQASDGLGLELSTSRQLGMPIPLPGPVRRSAIRAINEGLYRQSPRQAREQLESFESFFYTQDRFDWFGFAAPARFVEYQFVVPFERHDVVQHALQTIHRSGVEPIFSVLKRFGRSSPAPLSFPRPGWALIIDFCATRELAPLVRQLDLSVAEAGGRIYLAKDACLRDDVVQAMYPRLDDWRRVRARHDPDGVMRSDLAERLSLL